MRTVSGGETTVLTGRVSAQYLKVEIKNAAGTWIDYSAYLSLDWQDRCEIRQDVDQRVAECTLELARETEAGSLSPLINTEIAGGRAIRVSGSRVAVGAAVSHKLLFQGRIDRIAWEQDPMVLVARDESGVLVDRWVKEETEYGAADGTAIETVMQEILDDWAPGLFTLYTPTSPSRPINPYRQQKQSVLDALQALADLIGWVIEYRWDNGTGAFRLTFYEPDRTAATPLWTFGPDDYYAVNRLDEDSMNVRNAITVRYRDAATGARGMYEVEDPTSIAKYGEQWAEFDEADDSPIDSAAKAAALGDAALADLAQPPADQEIEGDLFWAVQLGDPYQFNANAKHYGANQQFAVTGYTHLFEEAKAITKIRTRGKPVGHTEGWLKRETRPIAPEDLEAEGRLRDWRFIYDQVAGTVTIRWVRGDRVHEVWVYDQLHVEPIPDNPWPTEGSVPEGVLEVGTDEWVTTIPEPGTRRFVQFETRDTSGAPMWVRRFEIDPPPIADINVDVADEEIAVGKLKKAVQDYRMSNPAPFSPLDYNTVQWSGFTLYTANAEYSIASGDTGNMTAGTYYYIYFDPAVSTTVLQVTTVLANSQGEDKVFLAIAKPKTDTAQEAFYLPAVGILGGLGDDIISANLVAANIIAANTITALLMNVGELSAIVADLGTVTAGTIEAGVIIAAESFVADGAIFEGAIEVGAGGVFSGIGILNGGFFDVLDNGGDPIFSLRGGAEQIAFFDKAQAGSLANQRTITGSRGGNVALASLLTALDDYGLVVDSSS